MAIRAQKYALSGHGPRSGNRSCDALLAEREALDRRIQMVEMKRAWVPVITTERARSANILDQQLLDVAASLGHRVRSALQAAIATIGAQLEVRDAVLAASHAHNLRAFAPSLGIQRAVLARVGA
jgi:hypothetical protein